MKASALSHLGSLLVLFVAGCTANAGADGDEPATEPPAASASEALALTSLMSNVSATRVAVGRAHACAVLTDGRVACWGSNAYGQLGIGTFGGSYSSAHVVQGLAGTAVGIEAGAYHTCATIAPDLIVQCWGLNNTLQTGATANQIAVPSVVNGITRANAGVGDYHSCVLTSGSARCWGTQHDNRLGDGVLTATETRFPQAVVQSGSPLQDLAWIAAGAETTCAARAAFQGGQVYCWGMKLSPSSSSPGWKWEAKPTWMATNGSAGLQPRSVAVGKDHVCIAVLSQTNGVVCWGRSELGQTGTITEAKFETDHTPVPGIWSVSAISAGDKFTCAKLMTGGAKCWGKNDVGQLGNGTIATSLPPVTVSGLTSVTQISASGSTACAIDNGIVQCWGNDENGQLGDGAAGGHRSTPQPVRWPAPVNAP